jgi:hypothetical protein
MSLGAGMALWLLAAAGFVPGQAIGGGGALDAVRLVYALPACLSGLAGILILMGRNDPGWGEHPSRRNMLARTA